MIRYRIGSATCSGVATVLALALLAAGGAAAAVGDVVTTVDVSVLPFPGFTEFCSIGVGVDKTGLLYYDRCGDPLLYTVTAAGAAGPGPFNPMIPELPNAMAYDAGRDKMWICTQAPNGAGGMPIYLWDFVGPAVLQCVIPPGLVNPATGQSFLSFNFCDGLAFDAAAPPAGVEGFWFSDDVSRNLGLFDIPAAPGAGSCVLRKGYDASTIDPSLSAVSGLAKGGSKLYLANNGGGDVFRAPDGADPLLIDAVHGMFASGDDRSEDLECDPINFAPTEVMWLRNTPQGAAANDKITAYEIEPGSCGLGGGGGEGACCTNGPGVASDCIETTQADCEADGGLFVGGSCNDVLDCIPLSVELESFTATATPEGVELRWTTAMEIDTAGFRLLRESGGTQKGRELVASFIPAAGSHLVGAEYVFVDNAPEAARATRYILEDIDVYGKVTQHPAALVDRGTRVRPAERQAETGARRR